ncbi:hypothetical protein [Chitinophaga filiformis]|uniref:Uncharacterized protein n=1 Tax=Chitinophaga filiformis TaxID=104663 RepID=A0ABY4HUJ2_CHIFI|nr:hypothetical protein [Chitinophaga filiformis]UPK67458.1 hypothetical protein MYF79_21170 [Chitinophaga filiformis]
MIIFESTSTFNICDFVRDSMVLLLRGGAVANKKFKYVDIKFVDVVYLDIPTCLRGITIKELPQGTGDFFSLQFQEQKQGSKGFVIESEGIEYVIIGSTLSAYYVNTTPSSSSIRAELKPSRIQPIVTV